MRLRWRRPRPALTDNDPSYYSRCFFHGPEPVGPDTHRICHECGHVWTLEAVVTAFNDILNELGFIGAHLHPHNVDRIEHCPLCAHDF